MAAVQRALGVTRRHSTRTERLRPASAMVALVLAGVTLAAPDEALAQGHELTRVEPLTLGLEVGGALALFAGSYFLLPIPDACGWCEPPGFDEALAAPAPPSERRQAAALSHVVSFAMVPALSMAMMIVPPFTSAEPDVHAFENVMIVGETLAVTQLLTTVAKRVVARQRPAFYYGRADKTEYADSPGQANQSFFSGDTSAPFAAVASAATIGFMRGYRSAPYMVFAGGALATSAAILRIRADVHWTSDVLTGALVGTAVGIAMPLLLHPRASTVGAGSERAMLLPELGPDSAKLEFFGSF
jgi:membrane-associated phospholipid phosphatase